jgi:acyl carrier protein
MNDTDNSISTIRAIVAEVLALSPDEIEDPADFVDGFQADSLNLIEIVAKVEKQYQTVLPRDELAQTRSVAALSDLVTRQAA